MNGQTEAFDNPDRKPLSVDDLLGYPAKLVLSLQPHITLLELDFPLDDFAIAVKHRPLRGDASNAMTDHASSARPELTRSRGVKEPTSPCIASTTPFTTSG